jgi:predicted DNA-binding transcriptional regulator AlpA
MPGYRKIEAKAFYQPVRLGENRVAFLEEEINEWNEGRRNRNGGQPE